MWRMKNENAYRNECTQELKALVFNWVNPFGVNIGCILCTAPKKKAHTHAERHNQSGTSLLIFLTRLHLMAKSLREKKPHWRLKGELATGHPIFRNPKWPILKHLMDKWPNCAKNIFDNNKYKCSYWITLVGRFNISGEYAFLLRGKYAFS